MVATICQLAIEVVAITIAQQLSQLVEGMVGQVGINDTAVANGARCIRGSINAIRASAKKCTIAQQLIPVQHLRHEQRQVLTASAQTQTGDLKTFDTINYTS